MSSGTFSDSVGLDLTGFGRVLERCTGIHGPSEEGEQNWGSPRKEEKVNGHRGGNSNLYLFSYSLV